MKDYREDVPVPPSLRAAVAHKQYVVTQVQPDLLFRGSPVSPIVSMFSDRLKVCQLLHVTHWA